MITKLVLRDTFKVWGYKHTKYPRKTEKKLKKQMKKNLEIIKYLEIKP